MGDADLPERTLKEKLLFYTTAFFILLGTFSLFAFLFLVPFVIDPAFTTIFMEFDETPALCVTTGIESHQGVSNCSWTSCREGCTKEIYTCTQIRVNYRRAAHEETGVERTAHEDESRLSRYERAIREYDYEEGETFGDIDPGIDVISDEGLLVPEPTGLMGNDSEWYFTGAKLFPNVKGCGYPPMLNCSIFYKKYKEEGTNFSCYYSRIDPGIVISDLDMWQVYMNLVYAMAIPIPSFIASVIYLTFAYFKIYNDDEETAPLEPNAEDMDVEGTGTGSVHSERSPAPPSGALTPGSEAFREDLASFGHQLKVQMADEMSRESLVEVATDVISVPG